MTSSDPEEPTAGDQHGAPSGGASASGGAEPTPHAHQAHRAQLPADVDAAFAAIVAGWAAEGAPRWPVDPTDPPAGDGPSSGVGTSTPPAGHPALGDVPTSRAEPYTPPEPREPVRDVEPPSVPPHRPYTPADPEAEEHFVPPEPPPMPRLGLSSLAGIGLLVIGVVLLAMPGLLGGSIALGIVPGLMAMTAGLGWLVFGLRRPQDRGDDGPDDGAVL